jgi:hypothetical protein
MYSLQFIFAFSMAPTPVARTTISKSGATQLGRSAMLAKVCFELTNTPMIRAK